MDTLSNDDHTIELICNAEGLRSLAKVSSAAGAEMDACFKLEDAARDETDPRASSGGQESGA